MQQRYKCNRCEQILYEDEVQFKESVEYIDGYKRSDWAWICPNCGSESVEEYDEDEDEEELADEYEDEKEVDYSKRK